MTAEQSAGTPGPRWRALLEARWQVYVQEVTELSLAYHVAAASVPGGTGDGAGQPEIAALLRRAVRARRKLADVEDALGRLAAGRFGSCEQCGSPVPAGLLRAAPETRYCARCDAPSGEPREPREPHEPPPAEAGPDGIWPVPLAGRATR
ncbi:MAG TPA: TraR/DksA C4-type zinc finger protein [Streptosporangiaceae bacterium]